ncbi:MAG TPA: GNAT family N-acetyltransferase [Clostridia bacterium]|nr:GNAT family N-acetyltransferase [Clostridia bacterium]
MIVSVDEPYRLSVKDIKKSGIMYASAFESDPVWTKLFNGMSFNKRASFFESPSRFGIKFGTALGSSEKMEGGMVYLPGEHADMTFLKMLRSGFLFNSPKVSAGFLLKMQKVFFPVEEARRERMKGKKYIYLFILGVDPVHQGKGMAGRLMDALMEDADKQNLPIYLETATQRNVSMYERRGFNVVEEVMHPIIDVPQWAMVRDIQ